MTKRDDFTEPTKRALALRVAYFCSNPNCFKLTAGPHSDPSKALTSGHAAHIHAASPKGPRYDLAQTPAQRRSIENGIWLCRECGDIVDKDDASYEPDQLRRWKSDHERLIAEVRTKGYSKSLELLRASQIEPRLAEKLVAMLEDRRALWVSFDAEFPDRVRSSLDSLRNRLLDLRFELTQGSPLDDVILSLIKTIHVFFNTVEQSDLTRLRCDSNDPEWRRFSDALATLRKSIGFQIANVCGAYGIKLSPDLQSIANFST